MTVGLLAFNDWLLQVYTHGTSFAIYFTDKKYVQQGGIWVVAYR